MVDKLSTWETSLSSQGLFRPGFDVCQSLGCSRHITNNLHIVISITSICWTHFWVRVMSDNKSFSAWVQKTKLYVSADSSFFWFLTFPTALWVNRGGQALLAHWSICREWRLIQSEVSFGRLTPCISSLCTVRRRLSERCWVVWWYQKIFVAAGQFVSRL